MRTVWKIVLPIVALLVGIGALLLLRAMKQEPERSPRELQAPVVDVVAVDPQTRRIEVRSQGVVQARATSRIGAQVSGVITWVAPHLAEGALVEAGAELLRIDDADYLAAEASAEADLAARHRELAEETAEAERASDEWAAIGEGEPSQLVLRQPQLAAIRARIHAAEAAVAKAKRDLERTTVIAPFTGRISSKHVDLGQRVTVGSDLLTVQASDAMEVELPITLEQLRFVELPLRGEVLSNGPAVSLEATIADVTVVWNGRITRTLAGLNAQTRMVHAVARIEQSDNSAPLISGLFLHATIQGREVEGVIALPTSTLRSGDRVFAYVPSETDSDQGALSERLIEVLERGDRISLVRGDLSAGEQVVSGRVPGARDGMAARTTSPQGAADSSTQAPAEVEAQP